MITIQGKEFRNFAEQINKNKEDIANLTSPSPLPISEADLKAYLLLLSYEDG